MEEERKRFEVQTERGVVIAREDDLRSAFRAAAKAPRALYVHDTKAPAGRPSVFNAHGQPTTLAPRG